MLQIYIPSLELFDEASSRILTVPGAELRLEHSLVSVSKWESKWKKPFLSKEAKTREETADYVRCMTITQNVNPLVYKGLTAKNIDAVNAYIDDPMTATTFKNKPRGGSGVITSEIIYYWMVALEIPVEFEKWHLNRLLTLIRVCDEKNQPSKKMSRRDAMNQYRSLNAARRRRLGTRG